MSIKKSNQQDNLDVDNPANGQNSVPEGEEAPQAPLNEGGTGTIKVTN